jgi:hypothetical protein
VCVCVRVYIYINTNTILCLKEAHEPQHARHARKNPLDPPGDRNGGLVWGVVEGEIAQSITRAAQEGEVGRVLCVCVCVCVYVCVCVCIRIGGSRAGGMKSLRKSVLYL